MSQIFGTVAGTTVVTGGNPANGSLVVGTSTIGAGYGGLNVPDIVGNIRLDQTWGSAQVMAAAHEVNANYYGAISNGLSATGHPGDKWGWAVGVGVDEKGPLLVKIKAIRRAFDDDGRPAHSRPIDRRAAGDQFEASIGMARIVDNERRCDPIGAAR